MTNTINPILMRIKNQNPLILNITNTVSIDLVANGLLSLGASPIMSFSVHELEDLIKIASVVIINIGTLEDNFVKLCHVACELANQYQKPIILDPVGAGASSIRTETSTQLLKHHKIAIIRGNAGEIMALAGTQHKSKGVDSQITPTETITHAEELSTMYDLAICMSGKTDVIIDQHKKMLIERGSALMPLTTGTGCLLSAVVGAFHAVHSDPFEAAASASLFYSVCGEIAEKISRGPGSFKMNFIDTLHTIPNEALYEAKN